MLNLCSVVGCGSGVRAYGFCNKHWLRLKRTGTAESGPRAPASLEDRFWRQVDRRSASECWVWLGSTKAGAGYGRIGAGGKGGKYLLAHRYSCELHHGAPPYAGAVVMHSCDNPSCVNPAHLKWATASENIKDAFAKGRKIAPTQQGISHPRAILNEDQVRFIRESNLGPSKLCRILGVSKTTVRSVLSGKTWKHLA